jgi:hypothetical protein
MSVENKRVNDKTKYEFNPLTGEFDLVVKFNPDRIITAERNAAGTTNVVYDMASGTYMAMEPQIVTDNNGNVIVVGK